jgi:osmotically-inducible protein OsmY
MNKTILILTSCLLGLTLGCSKTAEGMKKDNESARQDVASGASNMVDDASNASANMGVAAMLTPKIKLAITADKTLNADGNLINVDSTSELITLQGHVTSEKMKALAGEIAQKVMTENEAKQTLMNQLVVQM